MLKNPLASPVRGSVFVFPDESLIVTVPSSLSRPPTSLADTKWLPELSRIMTLPFCVPIIVLSGLI